MFYPSVTGPRVCPPRACRVHPTPAPTSPLSHHSHFPSISHPLPGFSDDAVDGCLTTATSSPGHSHSFCFTHLQATSSQKPPLTRHSHRLPTATHALLLAEHCFILICDLFIYFFHLPHTMMSSGRRRTALLSLTLQPNMAIKCRADRY